MKNFTGILTYIASLVIGIILLVFHAEAALLKGIIITIGVLVALPSAAMLIRTFIPRKMEDGEKITPPWYGTVAAIAGVAFGVWMLCAPSFFINFTVYTLSIVVILAGIYGIVYIVQISRPYRPKIGWYMVPALLIAAGIIMIIFGANLIGSAANIIAGILLIIYGVNGFGAMGREAKADIKAIDSKPESDKRKEDKKVKENKE